jgi:hypothetical protein
MCLGHLSHKDERRDKRDGDGDDVATGGAITEEERGEEKGKEDGME